MKKFGKVHRCTICAKTFYKHDELLLHRETHYQNQAREIKEKNIRSSVYKCPDCDYVATRPYNLKRHFIQAHENRFVPHQKCHLCPSFFHHDSELIHHYKSVHKNIDSKFVLRKQAFQGASQIMSQSINLPIAIKDLKEEKIFKTILQEVQNHLQIHPYYKCSLSIYATFLPAHPFLDGEEQPQILVLTSRTYAIFRGREPVVVIHSMIQDLLDREDALGIEGSGHVLLDILTLDLNFTQCAGLRYGCAIKIDMKKIPNNRHILHIPNEDDRCILYAIGAHFLRKKFRDPTNPRNYSKFIQSLSLNKVEFPTNLVDIETLVDENKWLDLNVNVLTMFQDEIYPIGLSIGGGKNVVNLLAIDFAKTKYANTEAVGHYLLITNLDGFLTKVYRKTRRYYRRFWCLNCMNPFSSQQVLNSHKQLCLNKGKQLEKYPIKGKNDVLKFQNLDHQYKTEIALFYGMLYLFSVFCLP